jgi:phosphinothricin acetyltransferase
MREPDDRVRNAQQLVAADVTHVLAITAIYAEAVLHGSAAWELEPPDAAEIARRMDDVQAQKQDEKSA